jgi:hypothetical protein
MEDQLLRYKPTTADTRYRDLQKLFECLVNEERLMRPPWFACGLQFFI